MSYSHLGSRETSTITIPEKIVCITRFKEETDEKFAIEHQAIDAKIFEIVRQYHASFSMGS
jgi:hypothetical protein